jgi:DNA-binding response OmpR family regulator
MSGMADSTTILVVEDNDRLRRFMVSALIRAGYGVLDAAESKTAFRLLRDEALDLVLLDLRLGDQDGMEILKTIRRQDRLLPVIIISSIEDRGTKIDGFALGCDDYLTKPFYMDELLARIRRMLVRQNADQSYVPIVSGSIAAGPFELDLSAQLVRKNGVTIPMRKKLFDLLLHLVRHPDTVISAGMLCSGAWSSPGESSENSLYVHIRHLRELVEDDPSKPCYIKTIRSAGYLFSVNPN